MKRELKLTKLMIKVTTNIWIQFGLFLTSILSTVVWDFVPQLLSNKLQLPILTARVIMGLLILVCLSLFNSFLCIYGKREKIPLAKEDILKALSFLRNNNLKKIFEAKEVVLESGKEELWFSDTKIILKEFGYIVENENGITLTAKGITYHKKHT